ncbi:MAG: Smr/MutS family protein [bacterium]|nr:Smr/MutS family protein [bacterium]MDE0239492.1 Smr/MutS family protein [bacterium]
MNRDEDNALWSRVTRSVTPLRNRSPAAEPPVEPERPAVTSRHRQPTQSTPRKAVARPLVPGVVDGLDRRQADRFRRGQLAIENRLDLHGFTQRDAHAELQAFLAHSQEQRHRVVLLITGKGQRGPLEERTGVLRRLVPEWLNEPSMRRRIVALAPARPQHGGDGAYYLYLKKLR